MGIYEPVPSEFTEEERQILESKATQEGGCCHSHIFCNPHENSDSDDDGKTVFSDSNRQDLDHSLWKAKRIERQRIDNEEMRKEINRLLSRRTYDYQVLK